MLAMLSIYFENWLLLDSLLFLTAIYSSFGWFGTLQLREGELQCFDLYLQFPLLLSVAGQRHFL